MRRSTKPFTVEIRRNGRQSQASSISLQPHWPEPVDAAAAPALIVEAAVPSIAAPGGRILPALDGHDHSPAPDVVKRQPRKRKPVAAAVLEWMDETIEPISLGSVVEAPGTAAPAAPQRSARSQRIRAARSDFPLGERWKARLPEAVRSKRRLPPVI